MKILYFKLFWSKIKKEKIILSDKKHINYILYLKKKKIKKLKEQK